VKLQDVGKGMGEARLREENQRCGREGRDIKRNISLKKRFGNTGESGGHLREERDSSMKGGSRDRRYKSKVQKKTRVKNSSKDQQESFRRSVGGVDRSENFKLKKAFPCEKGDQLKKRGTPGERDAPRKISTKGGCFWGLGDRKKLVRGGG